MFLEKLSNVNLADLLIVAAGKQSRWDLIRPIYQKRKDKDRKEIEEYIRLNSEEVFYKLTNSTKMRELMLKEITDGLLIIL